MSVAAALKAVAGAIGQGTSLLRGLTLSCMTVLPACSTTDDSPGAQDGAAADAASSRCTQVGPDQYTTTLDVACDGLCTMEEARYAAFDSCGYLASRYLDEYPDAIAYVFSNEGGRWVYYFAPDAGDIIGVHVRAWSLPMCDAFDTDRWITLRAGYVPSDDDLVSECRLCPDPTCDELLSCDANGCNGTCNDGIQNGLESDVDCGGGAWCRPCSGGKSCIDWRGEEDAENCASEICEGGICQ